MSILSSNPNHFPLTMPSTVAATPSAEYRIFGMLPAPIVPWPNTTTFYTDLMLSKPSVFYFNPRYSFQQPSQSLSPATSFRTEAGSHSWSLTDLIKEHGPLVWNTYWGIYFGTLGALALGVQSGILNPLKLVRHASSSTTANGTKPMTVAEYAGTVLSKKPRLARYAGYVRQHPTAANVFVAWIIAEAMEPIRIAATGVLVPVIANWRQRKQR